MTVPSLNRSSGPRHSILTDPVSGPVCLALGLLIIALVSRAEGIEADRQLWSQAIFVVEGEPLTSDAIPIRVRFVPPHNFPESAQFLAAYQGGGAMSIDLAEYYKTETIIAIQAPLKVFAPLLADGRLPEPGANEVLAGVLSRARTFEIDEQTFTVVGTLARGVGGLYFSYLVALEDHEEGIFSAESGATRGWIEPKGVASLSKVDPKELVELDIEHGPAPSRPVHAWGTILGMFLVALGGAATHIQLFRRLSFRHTGPLMPVLISIRRHPIILATTHLVLFGPFFIMMAVASQFPVQNMWLIQFFTRVFAEEGSLAYVGHAYETGNVFLAAGATFLHNYLVATICFSILPSVLIPFAGVLKNLLSFILVGFGMAPIWMGAAQTMVYHSITMTLELEAYVIASFIIALWPIALVRGLIGKQFKATLRRQIPILLSGTLLVGIMLAIAALYEAATLIFFRTS